MSIDVEAALVINNSVDVCTEEKHARHQDVKAAYNGSSAVFRLLRLETWGPSLMNLGFYRFRSPLGFLNCVANLELAQQRLVINSVNLLKIERHHHVLDVACGRGKSSFMVHCMYPEAKIVGMDLLEQQVQVARTLFDQIDNLSYAAGNAMSLDFADASFDRIMCLEAAFHFPDRAQFLREASRVLRPGGRLVVVDFAWNTNADRMHRDDLDTRLIREIWKWDDMSSIQEYKDVARESGLNLVSSHDWSQWVTRPIQGVFRFLSMLGNNPWGLRFLKWRNPLYRSFSSDDWKLVARAVNAHEHVIRHSKYMAFVFERS